MSESQGAAGIPLGRATTTAIVERRWPYGVLPISAGALTCLRVAGWAVAFFGVLVGIITIVHAPEGSNLVDARVRGIYLAIGWALVVGGIAGGILFNVVAGIGGAILDMWKSWHGRA